MFKKMNTVLWLLLGAVSIMIFSLTSCSNNHEQQVGKAVKPAIKAQVYQAITQDLELDKFYPAMIRSDVSAQIIARVQGVLETQLYQPGQIVAKGTPLFTIERATYAAAVDQQKADLASAQANLAIAQRNYGRYMKLFDKGAISAQQRDQSVNALQTSQAAVEQAKAALESAQINLNYTTVLAPVTGIAGLNKINLGNVVNPGTALVDITPLNPIEVRFQLPEEDALQLRMQMGSSGTPVVEPFLEIPTLDGQKRLAGVLDFIGPQVNENTSTVEARAKFDNPKNFFLPGQFVRVYLRHLMRFNVFVVPEIAVTQGLMGPQLYVLDKDNTVNSRTVETGDITGPWQIINKGIQKGDRIIVSDPASIQVGDRIDPQPFDAKLVEQQFYQQEQQNDNNANSAVQSQ